MGHLRMANILDGMLADETTVVEKHEASELFSMPAMGTIVKLWNFLVKKNFIRFANILIPFGVRIFPAPIMEVTDTAKVHKKLDELKPDIIISVIIAYNKALGSYAKKKKIPFYIMVTDIIPSFMDMVSPNALHLCYFDESVRAVKLFDFNKTYFSYNIDQSLTIMEGLRYVFGFWKDLLIGGLNSVYIDTYGSHQPENDARCLSVGLLAEEKHFLKKNREQIKRMLNLKNEKAVTIVSGSIGGKVLKKVLMAVCKNFYQPVDLLVVCGDDKDFYDWLTSFKDRVINPKINIIPLRFINNFNDILAITDCLICRSSAGVFIEAILNNAPILTSRSVAVTDRGCHQIIEKYKIGDIYKNDHDLINKLAGVLGRRDYFRGNIESFKTAYVGSYESKRDMIRKIILSEN